VITQRDAYAIAKKLGAIIRPGRRHEIAEVIYQGKYVASFGIRRGSRQESHSYIPRQLYISRKQADDLAACPLSADEYFAILVGKGILQ